MNPPFLHYCIQSDEKIPFKKLSTQLPSHKIIKLDGNDFRDEKSLVDLCNKHMGLALGFTPNDTELHWMRFNDLIRTDIEMENHSGCIIIVKNAENALRSTSDGLVRFGNAMSLASLAYAKPDNLGLQPDYAEKPKSVHTILCYEKIPQNAPNAALITF